MPPDELSIGMTARVKSMIPMPPIHCIMARQICMPWLMFSIESSTDAPVVVKPDMDSKKASLTDTGVELKMNGIMPKIEKTIQTIDVSRNPSRLPVLWLWGRM